MKDKIVTGEITNMETGETHDIIPFHYFPCDCEMKTIVKIIHVESFLHPEGDSRQIIADCLALDSSGFVFKLTMDFIPDTLDYEQKILSDLPEGKILAVSGPYSVLPEEEGGISLYHPTYGPLSQECSLEEVEEVFRVNNRYNKNRLT